MSLALPINMVKTIKKNEGNNGNKEDIMKELNKERRKYSRYDTDMKISFKVKYDIKTKVKFRVINSQQIPDTRKYSGVSKNISVEGLCFISTKKLEKGQRLSLEVYVSNMKEPVQMEGEVRWSQELPPQTKMKDMFHTGVQLISVKDKSVADSIHFDSEYKVMWSVVLESVFGNFVTMVNKLKDKKH